MPQNRGASAQIAAILTAHGEGVVAGLSVRSAIEAITEAEDQGLVIERLIVADKPSRATLAALADVGELGFRVLETDFGDQGLARNAGIAEVSAETVAFIDGDDLWSANWLTEAYRLWGEQPDTTVVHPEFNWFFDQSHTVLASTGQDWPMFEVEALRFGNYWDCMALAPRKAYLDHPFSQRDVDGGFAYEDWKWNCDTLAAGYVHRVAMGTIHFKRRRVQSQNIEASRAKVLQRMSPVLDYSWYADR